MGTTTLIIVNVNGSTTSTSTIDNFPYYNGPNYEEVLFMFCIFIAFASIAGWRFMFRKVS